MLKKLVVVLMAMCFVLTISTASMAGHDCTGKTGKGHTSHSKGKGHTPGDGGGSTPGPGPGDSSTGGGGSSSSQGRVGDGGAFGEGMCDSLVWEIYYPECEVIPGNTRLVK